MGGIIADMNKFNFRSEEEEIWFNLNVFLGEIRDCISAIKAIRRYIDKYHELGTDNIFLKLSEEGVEWKLFLETAKLFDEAKNGKYKNCSIKMLGKVLKDFDADEINEKINKLCDKFENTISRDTRNKKIAHHDLEDLRSMKPNFIQPEEIEELIEETTELFSQIGRRISLIEFPRSSIEDRVKEYEASILKLNN